MRWTSRNCEKVQFSPTLFPNISQNPDFFHCLFQVIKIQDTLPRVRTIVELLRLLSLLKTTNFIIKLTIKERIRHLQRTVYLKNILHSFSLV